MRFIYESNRNKPVTLDVYHDPDESVYYGFTYRPRVWQAGKEYLQATSNDAIGDIVIPTSPNGFYYSAVSSGVTDATEPTWPCVAGDTVDDACVTWKAISYDLTMRVGDALSSSTWTCDVQDVVLDMDGIYDAETFVRVSSVPVDTQSFTLTNAIEVTRQDGKIETFNRSMTIKVSQK